MGFSTWSFGPDAQDVEDTYQFIADNADIYSEQVDEYVPWDALLNQTALPQEFVDDINFRLSKKSPGQALILSSSLLNTDRSDLLPDFDGSLPSYNSLADSSICEAYFQHLKYLVETLDPAYLVMAMEVNELYIHSPDKWNEYRDLVSQVKPRLKNLFPNLPISESYSLHNWFQPEVDDPPTYQTILRQTVNDLDFAAISYYPFFKGQHYPSEFQQSFDFLHSEVSVPIALVETAHLAQSLSIPAFDLNISSDPCEQSLFAKTLLQNAQEQEYEAVIWWAHKDYDELWETFPDEAKDVGKLWRDTGLFSENNDVRPAWQVWELAFQK